jgi:hypothetical protein
VTETLEWVEIIVPATAGDVDEIAALLADACEPAKEGTEVRGDEVVIWAPLADQEATLAEVRAVGRGVRRGRPGRRSRRRSEPSRRLPEAEWRDAWKRYFHVTRISPRHRRGAELGELHARPRRRDDRPRPGHGLRDRHPRLDAAGARGAGPAGRRAAGPGPGARRRRRLGDPGDRRGQAVAGGDGWWRSTTTRSRWPRAPRTPGSTRVGDRIASAATPVGDVDGQFDLVLANIQAHVLRELLPGIAPRVAPGGTLVMSGLLSPQAEAVAEDYAAVGFTVEAIRPSAADPAWSSAVLRRPS